MRNRVAVTTLITFTTFVLVLLFTFSVSAQTINTGDATSGTVIENVVNTNIIRCCTPTPTQKPEDPTPTEEQPTPTPTTPPSNGGGGGDGGGGGQGGVGGPSAPSAPSQEVLGLAATSGENELFNLLKLLPAFGALLLGSSLLRKHA